MSNIIIPTRHQAAPQGSSRSARQSTLIETETSNFTATERLQAKNAMAVLFKHYPNYHWSVQINRGVMIITNLNLSGKWGFIVHMTKLSGDYRELIAAGGELLERYRVRRGRMNPDQIEGLARDFTKNFKVDKG